MMSSKHELEALADRYEAGAAKCVASGYFEFDLEFQRERALIVSALRLAARAGEQPATATCLNCGRTQSEHSVATADVCNFFIGNDVPQYRCQICGFVIDSRYTAEKPAISFEMRGRTKTKPPASDVALREALEDCRTHRESWRKGIEIARKHALVSPPDIDDKSYWEHELRAFDRVFKVLSRDPGEAKSSDGGVEGHAERQVAAGLHSAGREEPQRSGDSGTSAIRQVGAEVQIVPQSPKVASAGIKPGPSEATQSRPRRWRHKKRGTTYVEIGRGKMQCSWVREERRGGIPFWRSLDMTPVVLYRADEDGDLWVRPVEDFEDGRFEALPPQSEPEAAANSDGLAQPSALRGEGAAEQERPPSSSEATQVEPKAVTPNERFMPRMLVIDADHAVCVGGRWDGWKFYRHPDGQWVSLEKLKEECLAPSSPAST